MTSDLYTTMMHFPTCCLSSALSISLSVAALPSLSAAQDPISSETRSGRLPSTLAAAGLVRDAQALTMADGVTPYVLTAPFWSDHAIKRRWVAPPPGTAIVFHAEGNWRFPPGTVFIKHFDIALDESGPAPGALRRLETRLMVQGADGIVAMATYRWTGNTLAERVDTAATETLTIKTATGSRQQTWLYPAPSDCLACHTPASTGVLGISTRQLNRLLPEHGHAARAAGTPAHQLARLSALGQLAGFAAASVATLPTLHAVSATTAPLGDRVRAYLDGNCASCHRPGGVPLPFDARFDGAGIASLIDRRAYHEHDINDARLIAPGDPARSLILARVATTTPGLRMPFLGRHEIDADGAALLKAWILSLPRSAPATAAAAITPTVDLAEPANWTPDLSDKDLNALRERIAALTKAGGADATRGGTVFMNHCAVCHQTEQGRTGPGPNLGRIADAQNRDQLLTNIAQPSSALGFGYERRRFALNDGRIVFGSVSETQGETLRINLRAGPLPTAGSASPAWTVYRAATLLIDAIRDEEKVPESIMPADLVRRLSDQELADLIEFLASKRSPVAP